MLEYLESRYLESISLEWADELPVDVIKDGLIGKVIYP